MRTFKDLIETLRLAVEKQQHTIAKFRDKEHVSIEQKGRKDWQGDVYSFHLIYDSRRSGPTKEQIANWSLAGPSQESLNAAEQRGIKLKKMMLDRSASEPDVRRRAKLAYAWSSSTRGSTERTVHIVLHEGAVKSHTDAVKAAMGRGNF
jgi:hypothetical protein